MSKEAKKIKKIEELKPNRVELGGYEIWRNRRFEQWHQPFQTIIGPLSGCFNANCPYPDHYDRKSFTDPFSRTFVDSLLKAKPRIINNMLIQTDHNGLDETQYVTFDHLITNNAGEEELVFQEGNISWHDIRYAALVDNSRIKPFSKQGGQLSFRDGLSQIIGASKEEVCAVMDELNSLNWLDHLPVRMRFPRGTWMSTLSHHFDTGIITEFQRNLNYIICMSPLDVALTFGVIAQQNRLSRLRSLIPNWTPEKPEELSNGLNKFCEWYLKCVPNSENEIAGWKQQWKNMFKLKF